jgi:hypothetical protein
MPFPACRNMVTENKIDRANHEDLEGTEDEPEELDWE